MAKGKGCRPWFQNRTKSMGPFVSFQTRFFLASGKRVPTKMEKNHQILTLNLNEPSHGHNFSVASCRLFEASDFFTNPFPMKRWLKNGCTSRHLSWRVQKCPSIEYIECKKLWTMVNDGNMIVYQNCKRFNLFNDYVWVPAVDDCIPHDIDQNDGIKTRVSDVNETSLLSFTQIPSAS